jgi:aminodeoxyfutalosine synthase
VITPVSDFEAIVQEGRALTRAEAETLLASPDLVGLGMLGELARRQTSGDRVTFGRVLTLALPVAPEEVAARLGDESGLAQAGEIQITGQPASIDAARAVVREVRSRAGGGVVTGLSLAGLWALAGREPGALESMARDLAGAGLDGVADLPLDAFSSLTEAVDAVRTAQRGGLAVRRAMVMRATGADRLAMIERAAGVQRETGALSAFAPLPRAEAADAPSTGYDDVRAIAIARLMCRAIPFIQVDWALDGPKLAQVAIAYGANDIDGVAVVDALGLGVRRSPREDIERQIRAAFATPVERDGRYQVRA